MLQRTKPEPESQIILEPVQDLTEAYLVYLDEIYVGRVFKSIFGHCWLTSGLDEGRYKTSENAAYTLVEQWETCCLCRKNGLEELPF